MTDRDPRAAWRTPGDGARRQITVDFYQPRTVTRIGLINGDVARSQYSDDRRLLQVRWTFDGGRSVVESFHDGDPHLQDETIPPVTASIVTITLLRVTSSPPEADGNVTSIGELELSGWVN